jgi:hypothetical protein
MLCFCTSYGICMFVDVCMWVYSSKIVWNNFAAGTRTLFVFNSHILILDETNYYWGSSSLGISY